MRIRNNKLGFGIIELLFAIAIMGILSLIGLWYFSRATGAEALKKDAQGVVAILSEARSFALSSKNASKYGVHVEEFQTVLFEGDTYIIGNANNKPQTFNSRVHLYSTNLNGGGSDILFSRLTGETSNFGVVKLSLINDSLSSTTITINNSGVVE